MTVARPRNLRKTGLRRAKQARAKATVEAIVVAGARILAAKGWAGFTTNAVAAKAGVSIGSLYEYFPDKQAICDAILDRHLTRAEEIAAEELSRLSPQSPLAHSIAALVGGFVRLHADDPKLHRVLSSEVPIGAAQRKRVARLTDMLAAAVAAALTGRVANPVLSARLIVDASDALTHRWYVDAQGTSLNPDGLARELTAMFTAYVGGGIVLGSTS
jgi:AcrR family transcriptional regulator